MRTPAFGHAITMTVMAALRTFNLWDLGGRDGRMDGEGVRRFVRAIHRAGYGHVL